MIRYWHMIGLAGLVGVMVWSMRKEGDRAPQKRLVESDVKPFARARETEGSLAKNPRASAAIAPPAPAAAEKIWPALPFQYQNQLDLFQKLRQKVFLTEAEKAERRRIIYDATLLQALGRRLTEASLAPGVKASQDTAVDLLLEALKSGDKVTASQILKEVILDPQIENSSLERSLRENLAGIKAEVLYHWAAMAPDEAANVDRILPGPVSRKIWDNVSRRHESNKAESGL